MSDVSQAADELHRRVTEKLRRELGSTVIQLLKEPDVTEILLNPDGRLWVERHGQPMTVCGTMPRSQAEALMATVASSIKTQITARNPILECELPLDGSRFEALIPPVVSGPTFTIRRHASAVFSLNDYVSQGIMTPAQRAAIADAIESKQNILVVGGTGSGKTTLTNAIIRHMSDVCADDRLCIIEDTGELQCTSENAVTMRAVEHVDLTRLLKATMRLRPDRIIVGEVRDGAALGLLKAWNTGHPGGVATVHANSAPAGLIRMEQLVAEATEAPMQSLIAEAIDLVVFIKRSGRARRIQDVVSVTGHDGHQYLTHSLKIAETVEEKHYA